MRGLCVAWLGCAVASVIVGCSRGGPSERQEDIASLRTLGIAPNPLVATPSAVGKPPTTVEVTFYAAVPLGDTATLTPFVDSGNSEGALSLDIGAIAVEPGTGVYVDYAGFRLYSAKAQLSIPTAPAFQRGGGAAFVGGQLRYGFTIATATDTENIFATLDVFPAGAAQLSWQSPSISITAPANGAGVAIANTIDLNAVVTNPQNESLKIGWFASKGEISNRRAPATSWKLSDLGPQTLAVVVHGVQTRGFAVKVVDVTAQ